MILNILAISVLFGVVACGSYGNSNSYAAANPGSGAYFLPPRHYGRRNHWPRRRSSESDEKWGCSRLGVFNVSSSDAKLVSYPKIAYYTHQGKEKAIVVCENPQIQLLIGKSRNANPSPLVGAIKDYAIVSLSSMSGITLNCNQRKERYEAVNLITMETVPLEAIACIHAEKTDSTKSVTAVIDVLRSAGFSV